MAYYGSINNNFDVEALSSSDDTVLASLISYSQTLFYGISSSSSWITASAIRARAATDNLYGFALVHRRRGLIAYKEFYYDSSTSSNTLILVHNFEKSGNKNRIGNRIENWIRDNVSEFSHIDKIAFQGLDRSSASSAFATRWSGKTKNQITTTRNSSGNTVSHPKFAIEVTL